MTTALAATALIQALREREERRMIEKEGYRKQPPYCCSADVKQKVKRAGKVQKIQQPRVEVKWAQKRT